MRDLLDPGDQFFNRGCGEIRREPIGPESLPIAPKRVLPQQWKSVARTRRVHLWHDVAVLPIDIVDTSMPTQRALAEEAYLQRNVLHGFVAVGPTIPEKLVVQTD